MLSRLLLPVLAAFVFPVFAYHFSHYSTMSDDKKQLFAQLVSDYQRLQALEKKFPALREAHADDAAFEQMRGKIEAKIAQLKNAQQSKQQQAAPTLKAPTAMEEDVTEQQFRDALKVWYEKSQKEGLDNLETNTMIISTISLSKKFSTSADYPIIKKLYSSLKGVLSKPEMSVGEIATGFKTAILSVIPETEEEVKMAFAEAKRQYKKAELSLFEGFLTALDPAKWLEKAANPSGAPIVPEAEFIAHYSRLFREAHTNFAAQKDSLASFSVDTFHKKAQTHIDQVFKAGFSGYLLSGVDTCADYHAVREVLLKNLDSICSEAALKGIYVKNRGNSLYTISGKDFAAQLVNLLNSTSDSISVNMADFTAALDAWRKENRAEISAQIATIFQNNDSSEVSISLLKTAADVAFSKEPLKELLAPLKKSIDGLESMKSVKADDLEEALTKALDSLPSVLESENKNLLVRWAANRAMPKKSIWRKIISASKIDFGYALYKQAIDKWAESASGSIDKAVANLGWKTNPSKDIDLMRFFQNMGMALQSSSMGGQAFSDLFMNKLREALATAKGRVINTDALSQIWKDVMLPKITQEAWLKERFAVWEELPQMGKKVFMKELAAHLLTDEQVQTILLSSLPNAPAVKKCPHIFEANLQLFDSEKGKYLPVELSFLLQYAQKDGFTHLVPQAAIFPNKGKSFRIDGYVLTMYDYKAEPKFNAHLAEFEVEITLGILGGDKEKSISEEQNWQLQDSKAQEAFNWWDKQVKASDVPFDKQEIWTKMGTEILPNVARSQVKDVPVLGAFLDEFYGAGDTETNGEVILVGEHILRFSISFQGQQRLNVEDDPDDFYNFGDPRAISVENTEMRYKIDAKFADKVAPRKLIISKKAF